MTPDTERTRVTWRVLGLEQAVGEPESRLLVRAAREVGAAPEQVLGARIARKALDARRRDGVHRLRFVAHVDVTVSPSFASPRLARALEAGRVQPAPPPATGLATRVDASVPAARVVVVGSGPGGLFAAWILARNGCRDVTIVDRGSVIEKRGRELVAFHRTRVPNPESNLLFGEGGAGTYSDGKLYTRVDDPLEETLLEELVACGADPSLVYDARAHVGTDKLHRILPRFRARLEQQGVRFVWNTRVERLVVDDGRVRALETSAGEIASDAVVLAPGHSARDTWAALREQGVAFEAKPFQIGVRVEHPQELVDRAQHGIGREADLLGPASYALVARAGDGHAGAHSFCMCPGGRIVASVNEPGYLCTNGMSNSTHSSRWANAAIVATVGPREFEAGGFGSGPFAGVELQRALERVFFEAGGSDYRAPAQRASDFLQGRESTGDLRSSYVLGLVPRRVDLLLPPMLRDAIAAALARFERSIPGFSGPEGMLVGLESRSSGPVRMTRDASTRRSTGFANLYPVGEGAGHAGGIMSAALDGARSALALLEHGIR